MITSHIYWVQEDIPKAIAEITEAIRKNPRDPRFYHFRGIHEADCPLIQIFVRFVRSLIFLFFCSFFFSAYLASISSTNSNNFIKNNSREQEMNDYNTIMKLPYKVVYHTPQTFSHTHTHIHTYTKSQNRQTINQSNKHPS
jgi:hypothetical protein